MLGVRISCDHLPTTKTAKGERSWSLAVAYVNYTQEQKAREDTWYKIPGHNRCIILIQQPSGFEGKLGGVTTANPLLVKLA